MAQTTFPTGYEIQDKINVQASGIHVPWDTSITVPSIHAFIMVNYQTQITVWLGSTSGICVFVCGTNGNYSKSSSTNTITFGPTGSTDTSFTVTRSGSTFTFTVNSAAAITAFYI